MPETPGNGLYRSNYDNCSDDDRRMTLDYTLDIRQRASERDHGRHGDDLHVS